jgi:hypothetical protein
VCADQPRRSRFDGCLLCHPEHRAGSDLGFADCWRLIPDDWFFVIPSPPQRARDPLFLPPAAYLLPPTSRILPRGEGPCVCFLFSEGHGFSCAEKTNR